MLDFVSQNHQNCCRRNKNKEKMIVDGCGMIGLSHTQLKVYWLVFPDFHINWHCRRRLNEEGKHHRNATAEKVFGLRFFLSLHIQLSTFVRFAHSCHKSAFCIRIVMIRCLSIWSTLCTHIQQRPQQQQKNERQSEQTHKKIMCATTMCD